MRNSCKRGGTVEIRMCTPELKAVNGITVISSDKN